MTTRPPADLETPLSAAERHELTARFLRSANRIAAVVAALGTPREAWEPWLADALRPSPVSAEPLEALLRRWWVVFEAEYRLIAESRNRIVHGVPVPDGELRGADYLAERLSEITFRDAG